MKHPAISSEQFRDLRFFKDIQRHANSKLARELMEREIYYVKMMLNIPYSWFSPWEDYLVTDIADRRVYSLVSTAIDQAKLLTRQGMTVTADIDSNGNFSLIISPEGKACTPVNELILSDDKTVVRITIDPDDNDPAGTIKYVQAKFREERSLWNRIKAFFRK